MKFLWAIIPESVKNIINDKMTEIMDFDIPVEKISMNIYTLQKLVEEAKDEIVFLPCSYMDDEKKEMVGSIWGVSILIDTSLHDYDVIAEPEEMFKERLEEERRKVA
ncbi:MAG: hypothetical protein M0R03_03605 [Novosphingobium sp.]|nr:hypothetical protein [Novosphingobium sp.]